MRLCDVTEFEDEAREILSRVGDKQRTWALERAQALLQRRAARSPFKYDRKAGELLERATCSPEELLVRCLMVELAVQRKRPQWRLGTHGRIPEHIGRGRLAVTRFIPGKDLFMSTSPRTFESLGRWLGEEFVIQWCQRLLAWNESQREQRLGELRENTRDFAP